MRNLNYLFAVLLAGLSIQTYAGNKERIGQAGANQLLINPWASTSGFGGANSAFAEGTDAFNLNIAGIYIDHPAFKFM